MTRVNPTHPDIESNLTRFCDLLDERTHACAKLPETTFPVNFCRDSARFCHFGKVLREKRLRMKHLTVLFLSAFTLLVQAQQLQLHYDLRHSIDPQHNRRNFPSLSFEYFKGDTTGSFLFKMQTDLNGEKSNPGQLFLQVSKSVRFWRPKVYLSLNYSGGLGVAPPSYGFYIANAFAAGPAYPFQWKGAWLSANLSYRYTAFAKPSHDVQFNFYFGKGFLNYKILAAGSIVAWTQNRNLGTDETKALHGKKFAFFGDPQIWFRIWKSVSVGSRINLYYHVLTPEDKMQIYPTLALKNQF